MCKVVSRDSIVSSTEEFNFLCQLLTSDGYSSSHTTEKPRKRKRVRFSTEIGYSCSSTSSGQSLPRDEFKSLWYNAKAISSFKAEVRRILASGALDNNNKNTEQGEIRGLECCTVERQKQRRRTTRYILTSYRKGLTTEQIAEISERRTAWNKEVALLQACHDFFEVHQQPSLLSSSQLPEIENTPPPSFPFNANKRVSSVVSDDDSTMVVEPSQQRRVRRRTY